MYPFLSSYVALLKNPINSETDLALYFVIILKDGDEKRNTGM